MVNSTKKCKEKKMEGGSQRNENACGQIGLKLNSKNYFLAGRTYLER